MSFIVFCLVRVFVKDVHPYFFCFVNSPLLGYCLVFCLVRCFVKAVHPYLICFVNSLLFSYCLVFCLVKGFVRAVHLSFVSSTGSYSVGLCQGCLSLLLLFHQQAFIDI